MSCLYVTKPHNPKVKNMNTTTETTAVKKSPAERIVDMILEKLDKGISPWHCPWNCVGIPQSIDKRPYRGINAILLAMNPYKSPYYLTVNRCNKMGGRIKKGEHGHYVVFWDLVSKEETKQDGTKEKRSFFILKGYTVFNVEQTEGLPDKYYEIPKGDDIQHEPIAEAEAIWDGYADKPTLSLGGNSAYYSPTADKICIPTREQFDHIDEYYATLFHEASHSTGSKERLNRLHWDGFGSESYSQEELIAEISAQILCQQVGITRTLDNAAAYCKSWARKIRGENAKAIVQACTQAQKASDYILGKKPTEEKTEA